MQENAKKPRKPYLTEFERGMQEMYRETPEAFEGVNFDPPDNDEIIRRVRWLCGLHLECHLKIARQDDVIESKIEEVSARIAKDGKGGQEKKPTHVHTRIRKSRVDYHLEQFNKLARLLPQLEAHDAAMRALSETEDERMQIARWLRESGEAATKDLEGKD